ncbi:MAG TPA: glycosyltransferase family 4 protein [Bacteroidales bacterium]|nr:glycosyltransferase family 4 protein [Bacteroidales bacterium]
MELLSSQLSSKVLTIGPDYKNHRGGVGAVISVYSKYFAVFNFIPSYKVGSVVYKSYVFFKSLFKLFFTLISNRKIKIIHIHGASNASFYRKFIVFFIGRYLFREKIVYHIHGGGFSYFYNKSSSFSRRLIRILLSNSDCVITLSQSWYKYFNDNFNIKKLVVLPNIIDYPHKLNRTVSHDSLIFLFFGLISEAKGIFDLLNVIEINKDHYRSRMKLLIGGNGDTQKLKTLITEQNMGDIIEFLGWVGNEKKIAVFNNSDVFILPSYAEGLPISILEAMSYGKAIIATDVGGVSEIVRENENGILIEPGNLKQIEQAINNFLENSDMVKRFGEVSELHARKYLPDEVLKNLEEIYISLL